jgi:hypothetical protein
MSTTQTILAIYENGILRPLEPLSLAERTQVSLTVTSDMADAPPDFNGIMGGGANSGREVPSLDEVRKITSKIPVSLAQLVRQERDNGR